MAGGCHPGRLQGLPYDVSRQNFTILPSGYVDGCPGTAARRDVARPTEWHTSLSMVGGANPEHAAWERPQRPETANADTRLTDTRDGTAPQYPGPLCPPWRGSGSPLQSSVTDDPR